MFCWTPLTLWDFQPITYPLWTSAFSPENNMGAMLPTSQSSCKTVRVRMLNMGWELRCSRNARRDTPPHTHTPVVMAELPCVFGGIVSPLAGICHSPTAICQGDSVSQIGCLGVLLWSFLFLQLQLFCLRLQNCKDGTIKLPTPRSWFQTSLNPVLSLP